MHALDDVDPQRVEDRLRTYSLRVKERSPSQSIIALQANLHEMLFDEEGFAGNLERYYSALNSYLPVVLDTRYGLPITLSLIYKVVGQWAGLCVEGINAPGHFMVRVRCDRSWMIVDPFFGGQMLTRGDFSHARVERRPVVDVVSEKLVTPFGLRTLSPDHPDYKRTYAGDLRARDAAYHQGTVWPWLLGHYIDARLKVYRDKTEARSLLRAFADHLHDAGIGTISEIFDAEPPFRPRGCMAQAWSVAEVLRAYLLTRTG